jgi:hypothetical protein
MSTNSIRSLTAAIVAAVLLAILALPGVGTGASTASTASISASKGAPFAAYTRRRHARHHHHRAAKKVAKTLFVEKTVVAAVAPFAVVAAPTAAVSSPVDENALAQTILAGFKAQYPRYLTGATVEFGNAAGYQAISYYTVGRIVISPTHTVGVQRILAHEIWHIIDWQDNNAIDWGEAIPPANMNTYAN